MSKKVKLSILAVAVVGVGSLVAWSAFQKDGGAVEVRVEQVETRDLVASVTASGKVEPRTAVNLSADISGKITRLAVREGDTVTKGQFLLRIDPEQYEAALQRAQAGLASARAQETQARANYMQAERSLQRSLEIQKANPALIAAEQLDQLRTALEVNEAVQNAAKFSVQQAEASVRDAQVALARTTILSPMSGKVTRLVVEEGETAVPGTFNKDAATLMTIADMGVLETNVKVDETDVSRISVGDSAVIQIDAFPDTTFVGRVVRISNSSVTAAAAAAADQAIDYEVTIELVNAPSDTRPDFSATAKIITDMREKVLSIPIIALTVRENEPVVQEDTGMTLAGRRGAAIDLEKRDTEGVFVVGADNKVTFRPVKVGIAGEKYFEVVSGLQPGERIVGGTYQAIRELKEGALVREAIVPTATTAQAPTGKEK